MKDFTPEETIAKETKRKSKEGRLSKEEAMGEQYLDKIAPKKVKKIKTKLDQKTPSPEESSSPEPTQQFDLSGLSPDVQRAVERRREHLTGSKDTETLNLLLENPEAVFRADLEILKKQPENKRTKEDIAWLRKILGELVRKRIGQPEKKPEAPTLAPAPQEEMDEEPHTEETSVPLVIEETPEKKEEVNISELEEVIWECRQALQDIDEREQRLLQRLREIEEEEKKLEAQKMEIKTYPINFIERTIKDLLGKVKNIKQINKLEIKGVGEEIKISAEIVGSKLMIKSTIKLENATLVNSGPLIKLKEGYSISATVGEDAIKEKVGEHINSIGDELKKFVEKSENKKVKRIFIEDGQLKAEFI